MELLYYICILSSIGGLNGKEQKVIKYLPRKVLVIETDLEDQQSFFERNKGSDFIIYRFYVRLPQLKSIRSMLKIGMLNRILGQC